MMLYEVFLLLICKVQKLSNTLCDLQKMFMHTIIMNIVCMSFDNFNDYSWYLKRSSSLQVLSFHLERYPFAVQFYLNRF